ncbi:MAG: hypothetical protein RR370_01830 [Synergistaceae bacterium]
MNENIPNQLYENFLHRLVGKFFKIMPLKEEKSPTLKLYLTSLKIDIIGCSELIKDMNYDDRFLELLNVLQYFLSHEYDQKTCHREVMKCIAITKRLYHDYSGNLWRKND